MAKYGFNLILLLSALYADAEISSTDFIVESYKLNLTIPNTTTIGSLLNGTAVITLTCNSTTAPIVLNWGSSLYPTNATSSNITVVKTTTDGSEDQNITISSNVDNQTVTLTPETAFAADDVLVVTINYQTTVNAEPKGIFMVDFPDGNDTSSFLATNAWPISARDILPCLDQPDIDTGTWSLNLIRPTAWDLVSSLSATSSDSDTDTETTTDVLTSNGTSLPPSSLSIFLTGGAFTNTTVSNGTSDTTFYFWARSELNGTLNDTFDTLATLFYAVDNIISNNLTSVNIVLVPNLHHPFSSLGVIYIREDSYNVSFTSSQEEGLFRSLVIPVVQQYIKQYTLFSSRPATWSDYWISEAVGGYLEYTVLASIYPTMNLTTELEVVVRQSALVMDSSLNSAALMNSSINTDSPAVLYTFIMDPLKRLKGTALLNMLDMSLSAGLVLESLISVLQDYKNQSVTTSQFFSVLASKENLTTQEEQIIGNVSTWYNTTGYPLLNASVANYGSSGNVSFEMSAFCDFSSCNRSVTAFVVPATVGSKSDTRYLTPRQDIALVTYANTSAVYGNLTITDGDWIASNMQSNGYFRVNYTTSNWQLITSALAANYSEIPGFSQILDDSMALALAGSLSYNVALPLLAANLTYPEYKNWYSVYSNLWRLRDYILDTDSYSYFEDFATMVLEDVRSVLEGGTMSSSDSENLLALVFEGMCEYSIANYKTFAAGNLSDLLNGSLPSTVGSASYDAMVCCGAEYNSSINATSLRTTLTNTTATFYARHFNAIALGCLSNYTDISTQISYLVPGENSTISTSDILNKPYILTMYQYIVEKHPEEFFDSLSSSASSLQNLLGASTVASLILKGGMKINNATYISELTSSLANSSSSIDTIITAAVSQIESFVSLKTTWLLNNNATLSSALQSNTVSSGATTFSLAFLLPMTMCVLKIVIA